MENKDSEVLSIKIKLGLNDVKKYIFSTMYSNIGFKAFYIIGIIVVLSATQLFFKIIDHGEKIPIPLFCCIGGFLLFLIILPVTAFGMAKKIFKQNSFFSQDQFYRITSEYIEVETSTMLQRTKWTDIFKVLEYKDGFVIAYSITIEKAYVLPKTFFDSEEQIEQFREILRKSVSKSKIKISSKR